MKSRVIVRLKVTRMSWEIVMYWDYVKLMDLERSKVRWMQTG